MSYVGKIVKNTLIFAAVGALLALAAPGIASTLGLGTAFLAGVGHSTLWTSAFFGAFGGIHAAVEPIVSALLGGEKKQAHHQTVTRQITHHHGQYQSQQMDVAPDAPEMGTETTTFRDKIGKKSAENRSFQERITAAEADTAQGHTIH